MTETTTIDEAVSRTAPVLARRPAGLFSDFDGTLSPMYETPGGAQVHPDAPAALAGIAASLQVAGIVTGRAARDAQQKVGVDELLYVGNHGLESLYHGQHEIHPVGQASSAAITTAMEEIEAELKVEVATGGVLFENKALSASIHFRLAADPMTVGDHLLPIAKRVADSHGLVITTGKMIVELRPSATISKGSALKQIVEQHGLKGAIFLGDDVTDVDGFRALHELRDAGTISALSVGVITLDTNPSVIEASDVLLNGVDQTVAYLQRLQALLTAR